MACARQPPQGRNALSAMIADDTRRDRGTVVPMTAHKCNPNSANSLEPGGPSYSQTCELIPCYGPDLRQPPRIEHWPLLLHAS
eukprot:4062439-Amphidinium_carterae.1